MPIQRTAQVARTAHDRTHLNRVAVPEFGVVEIQVKGQGGSLSKSYRDASSSTPKAPSGTGTDSFHFAPGAQFSDPAWTLDPSLKDDVKIVYTLHNPQYAITTAKLEIFRRFTKDPIWTRDLTGEELLHGETTLKFNGQEEWDGKIGAVAEFPDEFLTVEHSAYKFKLTIEGDGINKSTCAWTYVHVIIAKLELEYGPDEAIPSQPANMEGGIQRETFTDLKSQGADPPAEGTTPALRVNIRSDIFKTSSDDMFQNQLYTRFETLWGKGPQIPIFCKIWVKSSADTDVVAPKALGRLKFLWDWESKSTAHATAFTAAAENYLVNKTKPKGRNCHEARGGKRGDKGEPVFPDSGGYAPAGAWTDGTFPFEVEAVPKPRKWAAYSYAWNDGIGGSKTGVIFQPARTAGDAYQITVYVDQIYDRKTKYSLNVDSDAPLKVPAVLKKATGHYQVWRQVNVRKYVKKNNQVTETINIGTVANEYAKAYLDLKDRTAGNIVFVAEADWTTRFDGKVNGYGANIVRMKQAVNQYTNGGGCIYYRTRDEYRTAYMQEVGTDIDGLGIGAVSAGLRSAIVAAAAADSNDRGAFATDVDGAITGDGGLSAAEAQQVKDAALAHWDTVDTYMTDPSNSMDTDAKYRTIGNNLARQVVSDCFSPEADADSGCTIFHCDQLHNLNSTLLGWAYDVPGGAGNRCGFLLCAKNSDHSAGDNIENTATHEFGHHFFLPHTPDAGEKKDYKAHDKSVKTCIMSYNVPTEFCGFCQLRLRGWSKDALSPVSSKNKKT